MLQLELERLRLQQTCRLFRFLSPPVQLDVRAIRGLPRLKQRFLELASLAHFHVHAVDRVRPVALVTCACHDRSHYFAGGIFIVWAPSPGWAMSRSMSAISIGTNAERFS